MATMSLKPRRVNFDSAWESLQETVQQVIKCGAIKRGIWNDRFSDVYALCVAYPEPLGEKLYEETKAFLESHVKKLYELVSSHGDENLLSIYHAHWQEYSKGSSFMNQLYGYLNTQFIKKQKWSEADLNYGSFHPDNPEVMLEVGELALDIWKKEMITKLKEKNIIDLLLQEIHNDRMGGNANGPIIYSVINSLVHVEDYKKKGNMKLYEELFEEPFLKQTGDYYRQEALKLLDKNNCSQYMAKVINRLTEEEMRSRKFLHVNSYEKVKRECQQRMVADHLQFLHGECRHMVAKEQRDDLRHMYELLTPIQGGVGVLVQEVEDHIRQIGMEAVKQLRPDSTIPTMFVESMLDVHSKYTAIIKEVFNGDQQFIGALDKACSAAINVKPSPRVSCKAPEWLAKYCDLLLKKTTKGMSETEIDDRLAQSITVFKYLDDKDIYQRFYSRFLAKRLIQGLSQSMDAEESMINRLKQACGYEFTNKLHRMFTDMSISTVLNKEFSDYLKAGETPPGRHTTAKAPASLNLNFSIHVLQAGAWPLGHSNHTFAIPQELEQSINMFEKFYSTKFSGRKLTWMQHLCNAELKLTYLKKPYFVTMGTYQMSVVLPFNTQDTLTMKELVDITKLPKADLTKQIQSLADAKLINIEPAGHAPDAPDTTITLNMSYSNKRTKFKVMGMVQKETQQEVDATHVAADEDRKLYLQATIVRIMKARKLLKHNLLIQEAISQSRARFTPSVSMIKKCIESLIDKQYIERRNNATDEYSYVA